MTENSGHRSYDELFIGGQWRKPANPQQLAVISPHSEEPVGHVQVAGPEDVDAAVAAARHAFDHGPWPRMTHADRMAKVEQLAAIYAGHINEMADLITDEMGSPRSFSRLGQAAAAASLMHLALAAARDFPWTERRQGVLGEVHLRRAPVGVVGAIVPWNVPQFLIMPKLIPALIAGCTVIIKPAPETPLDALWLAEMIEQLDLPDGVVSVLPGGPDIGEALVRHPGVDKIAFTGSSAVGRRIAALCGEQLKRVSLELGGKSAAIILDDADVDKTVAGLKTAGLMNNGQACVAQTRILVSDRRHDEVVDALAAMMSGLHVGDPADEATDIGPLVAQRQQRRVQDYIRSGQSEGARVVLGGRGQPGWARLVRAANAVRRRHQRHAHRPGGDFRPGLDRAALPRRGRRNPDRQRERLRSGRFGMDRRHRTRPRGRRRCPHRHLRHQHVHARHRRARSAASSSRASGANSVPRASTSMSSCSRWYARGNCRRYKRSGRHEGSRPSRARSLACTSVSLVSLLTATGALNIPDALKARGSAGKPA